MRSRATAGRSVPPAAATAGRGIITIDRYVTTSQRTHQLTRQLPASATGIRPGSGDLSHGVYSPRRAVSATRRHTRRTALGDAGVRHCRDHLQLDPHHPPLAAHSSAWATASHPLLRHFTRFDLGVLHLEYRSGRSGSTLFPLYYVVVIISALWFGVSGAFTTAGIIQPFICYFPTRSADTTPLF